MLTKPIPGGQTGVDRAALDVAQELGLPSGGWCPRGRLAEDAPIPPQYPLRETPTDSYTERTEWNVRDSDGTLVFVRGSPAGGSKVTIEMAAHHKKPCLVVDLGSPVQPAAVLEWLVANAIEILNVAGPRESQALGIYNQAREFLRRLFALPGVLA